eukprot:g47356.t1
MCFLCSTQLVHNFLISTQSTRWMCFCFHIADAQLAYLYTHDLVDVFFLFPPDAQLAYLYTHDLVDVVITEDSDLLVFGCKILTKLDREGNVVEFDKAALAQYRPSAEEKEAESDYAFLKGVKSCTGQQFMQACILSGCDYLEGIRGIGLKTAMKMTVNNVDFKKCFSRIETTWQEHGKKLQRRVGQYTTFPTYLDSSFRLAYCFLDNQED